ncbi:MAG: GNAT family N-acetyltransferase [Burkholderiaceae bacterium]
MTIRDAASADFSQILALNEAHVHFLSALDEARLASLHAQAAYHRVNDDGDGVVGAFLLALREGQTYDSPNYSWFASRYSRFLYIDRIVIAATRQSRGLGRALYDDLLVFARASDVAVVVCEIDEDPPNPTSMLFHQARGFREVGSHVVGANHKRVSLQELALDNSNAHPGADGPVFGGCQPGSGASAGSGDVRHP